MFTIWAKKAKENLSKVNKKVENQPITDRKWKSKHLEISVFSGQSFF